MSKQNNGKKSNRQRKRERNMTIEQTNRRRRKEKKRRLINQGNMLNYQKWVEDKGKNWNPIRWFLNALNRK